MEDKYLSLLLLLLPGFITDMVKNSLAFARQFSTLDRCVRALAYSLINYLMIQWVCTRLDITFSKIAILDENKLQNPQGATTIIIITISISILFGIILAILDNYDILYKIARKIRITAKTGRGDIWQDMFLDNHGKVWAQVFFDDGTVITGYPEHYSDDPNRREIFLGNAEVVPSGNAELRREINGPGVYIDCSKIKVIELSYGEENNNESKKFFRKCWERCKSAFRKKSRLQTINNASIGTNPTDEQ